MASIRLPENAEPILRFCRSSKSQRAFNDDESENYLFATYAELITFAASLGFHRRNGVAPDKVTRFCSKVDAVSLDVFRNNDMLTVLLVIGLAVDKGHSIAKDEGRLCSIIEGFAHEGLLHLCSLLERSTPSVFHRELIQEMRDVREGAVKI